MKGISEFVGGGAAATSGTNTLVRRRRPESVCVCCASDLPRGRHLCGSCHHRLNGERQSLGALPCQRVRIV